ncbi:MAG: AMP-binding protein [Roseovarius sp.]|nr:AMP-binding protein [Roseovarius sp.]
MLQNRGSYDILIDRFKWDVPDRLNMAVQTCDRLAETDPDRVAIICLAKGRREITYGELRDMSDRIAFALVASGVSYGDRVGVLRSQDAWCAAAHIAIWKTGAVSVPLFKLFRYRALAVRLSDSKVGIVIADADGESMLDDLENVQTLLPESLKAGNEGFETADTASDDPAVLIYTSGTTGSPKGALHAHRVLTGHLPGVEISHDFLGRDGDCLWTPADWAWIGGLFDVLMPGLALGVPVVAARMPEFKPETCIDIIREGNARNVFFPPTALRMLKASGTEIKGLRSVASGGEPLGAEMLEWGKNAFGLTINEFYGQTECNMVASSCGALFAPRPNCIGRPVPGHEIAVLNDDGGFSEGEGDVAIRRGSASMMLEYLNRPEETAEKFRGEWMLTGDRGVWEEGYLRFIGRADDVITSSGYRIGPAEIEDCLMQHPSVANVGVVGKPDELRTEIVKAYVVLKTGFEGDDRLAVELREFVKSRLAAHCHPRQIGFLDELPMTVTGKVIRKELKKLAIKEQGRCQ